MLAVLLSVAAAPVGRAQEEWTPASLEFRPNLWGVAWGAGRFVAVGEGGAIYSSPDGLTWAPHAGPRVGWLVGVGYGDGRFVVVGEQGAILTSIDGVVWTARVSGTTARINGVAYGSGRWIAVAESGEILTSRDAVTWTRLDAAPQRLHGIAPANGMFVITGDNGVIRTLIDTVEYQTRVVIDRVFFDAAAYGRRMFVAVGGSGNAVYADDGVNWLPASTRTSSHFRGLAYFNGVFVAAGSDGVVVTTADPARGWTVRNSRTTALLTGVAASDTVAVVVGFNGTILRSALPLTLPAIVGAPQDVSALAGDHVLLEVNATGTPPLTYEWQRDGVRLEGETSSRLVIANLQPERAGNYSVIVRNGVGGVTCPAARVALSTVLAVGPLVDETFLPQLAPGGTINAVADQADGRLLVGGEQLLAAGGISPFVLVRLLADGSLDRTFNPRFDPGTSVTGLLLQPDGRILVHGRFAAVDGVARPNLARLNPDGSHDAGFQPPALFSASPPEHVSLVSDGRIYAVAGRKLYRLLSNGTSDTSFAPLPVGISVTRAFALPDGRVLASAPTSTTQESLLRFNPNGTPDVGFPAYPPSGRIPFPIVFQPLFGSVQRDRVLVAMRQSPPANAQGVAETVVDRLALDGTVDAGSSLVRLGDARAVAFGSDGRIYSAYRTGAPFGGTTVFSYGLRRLLPDGSTDLSYAMREGPNAEITGVAPLRDGKVAVFGRFTSFDNFIRPNLVRTVAANAPPSLPPVIVSLTPEAVSVKGGSPLAFSARVAGSAPLSYSWRIGGTTVVTAGPAVEIPTTLAGVQTVTLTVTNRAGSVTSAPVKLVVGPSAPVIVPQAAPAVARAGSPLLLAVNVGGTEPFSIEWYRGNQLIARTRTVTLPNVTAADAGEYFVIVTNAHGSASTVVRVDVDGSARLTNISTRAAVASGEQSLIAGFIVTGPGSKDLLIRGIGPGLAAFQLNGLLSQPVIRLFDAAGRVVASDLQQSRSALELLSSDLAAFRPAPGDTLARFNLPPGSYTLQVTDAEERSGIALAEVYEVERSLGRIGNLSSRAFVGPGAGAAISGIIVQGERPGRFLVRAVGPTLARFGVTGALADPLLTLTTATGVPVGANDDWVQSPERSEIAALLPSLGAFPLDTGSRDAALLVTLAPGNYTAIVSGRDGSGVALVEVYEIP